MRAVEHPRDVDDEAAAPLDHHRRREPRREGRRPQAAVKHQVPVAPLDLPEVERRVGRDLVAAPGVVHEQIESPVVSANAFEDCLDLLVVGVVAPDRDPDAATFSHRVRGVVDRSRTAERRRLTADAAARDVDRRSPLAEDERDALAAAATRARHERDRPGEGALRHARPPSASDLPSRGRRLRRR